MASDEDSSSTGASAESSEASEKPPLVPTLETARPPYEAVLLVASLLAFGSAAGSIAGAVQGWSSPTLGVLFIAGAVETLVALGLAIRVLGLHDKRVGLFVPGATFAALAAASLAGVFVLSGSI